MPVPEFILRNFYIKDSIKSVEDGFTFELSNKIISANIHQFSINDFPETAIRINIGHDREFSAKEINQDHPFEFSVGVIVIVKIFTTQKTPSTLHIMANTKEFGPFSFSIETGKKKLISIFKPLPKQRKSTELNFSDKDWERIHKDYQAWFEHDLDRPLIKLESWGQQYVEFIGKETNLNELLSRQHTSLCEMKYYGDSFPQFWPNFGAGVAAAWLGSEVKTELDTAWFYPVKNRSLDQLNLKFSPGNFWWRKTLAATKSAVKQWGGKASIGITDIGGNLDILASLGGSENLLTLLIDAPDLVDMYTSELTSVWLDYYNQLTTIIMASQKGTSCWGPAYFPGKGYYLQSDFSYMISPKMFERWVFPDLEKCCQAMDCGFYHLDGKGQIRHLDIILSIKNLRGVQWVPGDGAPPPENWLPLLAKIRDSGKLCQVGTTRQGAMKIIRELGGKGFLFEIQEFVNQDDASSFLDQVNNT